LPAPKYEPLQVAGIFGLGAEVQDRNGTEDVLEDVVVVVVVVDVTAGAGVTEPEPDKVAALLTLDVDEPPAPPAALDVGEVLAPAPPETYIDAAPETVGKHVVDVVAAEINCTTL
jgi:hypothetical protein